MLRTRQAGIRAESRAYGPDTSGDSQKLENIEDGQGERHCPFCSPAPLGPSFPTLHRGKAWSRATAMYRASNGKIRLGQHPKTCSVEEKEWYVCAESPLQHPQISRETQGGTEVRDASLAGTTAEWLVVAQFLLYPSTYFYIGSMGCKPKSLGQSWNFYSLEHNN